MFFVSQAGLKDEDYKETEKCLLRLGMYNSLFNIPMAMRLFTQKDTVLPTTFYHFVSGLRFDSPALRNIDNLNDYLKECFAVMETKGYLNVGLTDFLQKRAALIGDPVVREDYLIYALEQELTAFNQYLPEVILNIEHIFNNKKNQQRLQVISRKYQELTDRYERLGKGKVATDFAGTDQNNQKHSLKDYLGKVVVVDVWSTNCIPCIGEIPYLLETERQFDPEEVVFISYSVDRYPKEKMA